MSLENSYIQKKFISKISNLYNNKVIYHERFTIIGSLENIKVENNYFSALIFTEQLIFKGDKKDSMFQKSNKFNWKIRCNLDYISFCDNGFSVYSSWIMWTEPKLVEKVEKLVKLENYNKALDITLYKIF